jgi:hypothetical protein
MTFKLTTTTISLLLAALVWSPPADAQQSIAEEVMQGCESELESYCSEVTPGEGRIAACLYAHGDKLSGQCEVALYDAAVRLERAINAITYVASECMDDIESLCANVQVGEGRIAQCLADNEDQLSDQCTRAIEEVGASDPAG